MHAVIWTDVMQFFVLITGLIAMIGLGLHLTGGLGHVIDIGKDFGRFNVPRAFSLTDELSLSGGLLLGFVGMLSSAGADQVVLQQYLTATSDREAKASLVAQRLFPQAHQPGLSVSGTDHVRVLPDASGDRAPDADSRRRAARVRGERAAAGRPRTNDHRDGGGGS